MNDLGYNWSGANGGSFTLLVDGQPLAELTGGLDWEVPFILVERDELPCPADSAVLQWIATIPEYRGRSAEVLLVGVCDCGEQGCGCTVCRVIRHADEVVVRDILGSGIAAMSRTAYRFSRANYEAVVQGIRGQAMAHRGRG